MFNVDKSKSRLFICGDSFCYPDPAYGSCWVDLIAFELPDIEIINLSSPSASNYLIYLQVKQAIDSGCDYLIYHATSSIRHEFSIEKDTCKKDHIGRYWAPRDKKQKTMLSTTWVNANRITNLFSSQNDQTIKQFFADHIDFPSMVYKNYIFIDYTLKTISENLQPYQWAWSRGGFEHKKFVDSADWDFSKYHDRMCRINLWDDFDRSLVRPYYHVLNSTINHATCQAYIGLLNLKS